MVAGNLFIIFRYFGIYDFTEYFIKVKPVEMDLKFLEGNIISVYMGVLLSFVDFALETEKFKRKSFQYIILAKSVTYSITMYIGINLIFIMHGLFVNRADNIAYSIKFTLSSPYSIALFIYGVLISVLISFIKEVNKKFGPGILFKLFSGKYYEPRVEERIFMFLDLKSSTTIAEKLGHLKYSRLIQDCFYDVTDVVAMFKAEIYQYVGDEIVLTWELDKGIENDNCFRFFFEFQNKLERKSNYYNKKYGVVPYFKAGMNCGFVTVAEVGEIKKEIAYHGDVLNTAARIQDQCNVYDKSILISHNLNKKMPRSNKYKRSLIGEIILKGKETPVGIYSLELV